ncbi:ribonuclease kappa-like [Battus philenor]|uniref:ribonuclease kappa-like n=1 Tax=Battus philenor TaxID=42288 RepID=UPI0035D0A2DC
MAYLYNCGLCCIILSTWGFVQLIYMGINFKIEAVGYFEDVVAEEYEDYDDFIKKTKENYQLVAVNCWIAAAIYAVLIGVSYFCIVEAKRKALKEAQKLENDELYCEDKSKVV